MFEKVISLKIKRNYFCCEKLALAKKKEKCFSSYFLMRISLNMFSCLPSLLLKRLASNFSNIIYDGFIQAMALELWHAIVNFKH